MKILPLFAAFVGLMIAASCARNETGQSEEHNQVIETIMARRSIRNYKPVAVHRDTLDLILKCGINAPNGMNKQSWEVRVVDNPELMDEICTAMMTGNPQVEPAAVRGCFRGAPVMVFIANDPSYDCSPIDCGLLSENIMLAAWSLGVGSVCLGSPVRFLKNSPAALEKLDFSEGYAPIICIGLGYAAETPEAKSRDLSKVRFVD